MTKKKIHRLIFLMLIAVTILLLTAPQFTSTESSRGSRASGNSCGGFGCHPRIVTDIYDEFVNVVDVSYPPRILLGDSKTIFVNVSITSTTYTAPDTYYRCDVTVTLTSQKGKVSITGSPKKEFTKYPGYNKQFAFPVTGDILGNDTVKVDAKIVTGHAAGVANESVNLDIEVFTIPINLPPQLLDSKVSPASGDLETDFTYSVLYQDPEGDIPVDLFLFIDDGNPTPLSPLDGMVDTLIAGERYGLTKKGSDLGLGKHTYRFSATDGDIPAVGDILKRNGPEVTEVVVPNTKPTVKITSPVNEDVNGIVKITGTAADADPTDSIGLVEVRMDNGPWRTALGGEDWNITWDFTNIFPAKHVIYARASDGKVYSDTDYTEIRVVSEIPIRPVIKITESYFLNKDIIRINGSSIPASSSIPVEIVEVYPEDGPWEAADAAGPLTEKGYRTYELWVWNWEIKDIDNGQYTIGARARSGEIGRSC
jgi:hypothetical protein